MDDDDSSSEDVVEDDSEVLLGSSDVVEDGGGVELGVVRVVLGVLDVKRVEETSVVVVASLLTMLLVGVGTSLAEADVAAPETLSSSSSSSPPPPPPCLLMISWLALPRALASILKVWAMCRKERATRSSWNNRIEYMMTVCDVVVRGDRNG